MLSCPRKPGMADSSFSGRVAQRISGPAVGRMPQLQALVTFIVALTCFLTSESWWIQLFTNSSLFTLVTFNIIIVILSSPPYLLARSTSVLQALSGLFLLTTASISSGETLSLKPSELITRASSLKHWISQISGLTVFPIPMARVSMCLNMLLRYFAPSGSIAVCSARRLWVTDSSFMLLSRIRYMGLSPTLAAMMVFLVGLWHS